MAIRSMYTLSHVIAVVTKHFETAKTKILIAMILYASIKIY